MARKFNLMTGKWDEIANTSGSAGSTATFITVSAEPTLPNSRRLAVSGDLTLTDGGPGGTITVGHIASGGTVTSVAGGVGITNTPEPITTTGTVDLDINSLTTETVLADNDLFPFLDSSVGITPASQRKASIASLRIGVGLGSDPRRLSWWQLTGEAKDTIDNAAGTAISITRTGVAAGTVFADNTGRYDSLKSAAAISAPCGWLSSVASTRRQFLPDISWAIKTGPNATDLTNCRIWCLCADTSGDFAVAVPASAFGFRFNPADAADTHWIAFTSNATPIATTFDTGIVPVVDTRYVFRCVWTTINSVDFYVNGTYYTTLATTANMPTATLPLFWQKRLVNSTAVARELRVSRVYLSQL